MSKPDPASAPWRLRLALLVVRLAARLVPPDDRSDWRDEWEGELLATALPTGRRRFRAAWGAIPDAYHLSRESLTMGHVRNDVAFAVRGLRKRPGFALVAVATLGIGIGATSILFSVVNGVLLSPFPYPDPDRVVRVVGYRHQDHAGVTNVSYPNVADLDRSTSSFTDIAAAQWWRPALLLDEESRVLVGSTVTGNYFDVFGVAPALGRLFRDGDAGGGRVPRVVVSHRLWRTAFHGDSGIVGRAITLSNSPYTVIGVADESYEDPGLSAGPGEQVDIWRTVGVDPAEGYRSGRSWRGIARIRPGISPRAAGEELAVVMAGLAEEYPEENAGRGVRIIDLKGDVVGTVRPALLLLLGAVGVVLMIACANVASLLLSRALERRQEMAIRLALGAERRRLVVQLMIESAVLASAGAVAGLALAAAGVSGIVAVAGPAIPRAELVRLDLPVVAFTLVVASLTVFIFGMVPAFHALRQVAGGASLAVRASASRETRRLHQAIVVGEIALSMVLVVGATLLAATIDRLTRSDLGIESSGVLTMALHGAAWWEMEEEAAAARYRMIREEIEALPGVSAAGAIDIVPLSDNYSCDGITPLDRPPPAPGEGRCAEVRTVTPGAIETLAIPLRSGRLVGDADRADAPRVMVVSAAMAAAFWPGEDALGKRAEVHGESFEVVGAVGDIHPFGPGGEASPMVYLPATQEPWNGSARGLSLVVRGSGDVTALTGPIREILRSIDPSIPVYAIATIEDLLGERTAAPRFRSILLGALAGVALFLSVVGIGGVLAYAVRQRSRELGIRQALGATPGSLRSLVMREGMALVGAGVLVGTAAALAASSALERFLYGISAREPAVFLAGALVLTLGVLVGSYLPALRAGRTDPMAALRAE